MGLPSADRPWLKYYDAAHVAAELPGCTLYEYLLENNRDYPDDIACHYLSRTIRYGEVLRQIDLCTQGLLALGVQRNDIVTVAMPSMPEAVYLVYALNRLGAVANMIHPMASVEETLRYLNEVPNRLFFMFTGTYAFMRDHLDATPIEKAVVVSPAQSLSPLLRGLYSLKNRKERVKEDHRVMTWDSFIRQGRGTTLPQQAQRADDDWAVISHTGGTTGDPKGVVNSNMNIIGQMWQMVEGRGCRRQDCMMIQLPPFINYSLVTILESFCYGFRVLLIPKYEPAKLPEYIHRYKVNFIHSIPAYWEALFHLPNIRKDAFASLRAIASGGESMDVQTEQAVNDILHAGGGRLDLMMGLGMTESTSGVVGTYPWAKVPGSVGIPFLKTNCKIVDVETGEELTYGEEGEICFAGPTIMVGYYNNSEATAAIIETDSDGTRWLHTGDVGYITREGHLFITGRLKRLIMQKDTNGMVSKIFPERIESVIMQMPEIEECCVVGRPDPERIARPVAYVVVSAKKGDDVDALADGVIGWCRDHLPPYMVPTEVMMLDAMPRTNRGKIDYRSLASLNQ